MVPVPLRCRASFTWGLLQHYCLFPHPAKVRNKHPFAVSSVQAIFWAYSHMILRLILKRRWGAMTLRLTSPQAASVEPIFFQDRAIALLIFFKIPCIWNPAWWLCNVCCRLPACKVRYSWGWTNRILGSQHELVVLLLPYSWLSRLSCWWAVKLQNLNCVSVKWFVSWRVARLRQVHAKSLFF